MNYFLGIVLGIFFTAGSLGTAVAEETRSVPVWPVIHFCGTGKAFDSYGLGMREGFLKTDQHSAPRRKWIVDQCFREGVRVGTELIEQTNTYCGRDWEQGEVQGFLATPMSAGSPCYSSAYTAGLARRRAGAREADLAVVGLQCVTLYADGFRDGAARQGMTPDATAAARACYDAGFWDGSEANATR